MILTITPLAVPLKEDADGVVRVGGTRVTLDTVIGFFEQGESPEQIAEGFPTLTLADIYAVIGYYLRHRADVDAYLERRKVEAAAVRREIEAQPGHKEFRERLLARRASRSAGAE